jgi:Peptidase family M41
MAWERRHVAIHEAGHAVMACRFNIEIIKVSIIQDSDVAGRVFEAWPDEKVTAQNANRRIPYLLGGYAASVVFGSTIRGSNNDFEEVRWPLQSLELGSLDAWKARAVDLMRRPSNVRSVELVVEQLMQCGEVGVEVVKACIATADSASAS